ncbi:MULTISPECIES: hypothetical protein [Thermomonosporaceae]|uniref:hypothetical protein n=1 Tax=Thermomonosporaceae TaxID=2012 RepID=UPI00255AB627|nr:MULTISPECIES: hypothetical protein [Thermomonosporaceae]MDL4773732.1 hypothetical protein [Actinomadura xylanilytica]
MTRAEALRDLVARGKQFDAARLRALADELGLPLSDILVIAGHPVPALLLPPARDREVLKEFAYRVTFCDHARLGSLEDYVSCPALGNPASAAEVPEDAEATPSGMDRFARIFSGFLRNRGFGVRELPFAGLSRVTINGMMRAGWHNMQQLKAMTGPLGWSVEDLAAVAGEPWRRMRSGEDCSVLCHHVGRVYIAAISLTTSQLMRACVEADRMSSRVDEGAWKPWAENRCPDEPMPETEFDQP